LESYNERLTTDDRRSPLLAVVLVAKCPVKDIGQLDLAAVGENAVRSETRGAGIAGAVCEI